MIKPNPHIELLENICKKIDEDTFVDDEDTSEFKKFENLQKFKKRYSWKDLKNIAESVLEIHDIHKLNLELRKKKKPKEIEDLKTEIKNKSEKISRYGFLSLLDDIEKLFEYNTNLLQFESSEHIQSLYQVWYRDFDKKIFIFSLKDEHWHEFCRLTSNFEVFSNIRDSILRCIANNAVLERRVFDFKYQDVLTKLPDRKVRIKKLDQFFKNFQTIYQRIVNEVSYENRYIKKEVLSPNGIILWREMFLKRDRASTKTICLVPNRKFDTVENIFVVLCLMQISEKAKFLRVQNLEIKLDLYEINVLAKIINGSEKMLRNFPYRDALILAKQENSKDGLDNSLRKYENKIRRRFSEQVITNRFYMNLLKWHVGFQKEIRLVRDLRDGDQSFLYESTRSIDTAYEFFIFFNLFDFMSRLDNCQVYDIVWEEIPTEHHFDFVYKDNSFRFIHDFKIKQEDTEMKLRNLSPDFFVEKIEEGLEKNKGVLVGDVKNYTNVKGFDSKNIEHLIENYMNQTKVSSGLIISRDRYNLKDVKNDQFRWSFEYLDPLLYQKIDEFENQLSQITQKIFRACDKELTPSISFLNS